MVLRLNTDAITEAMCYMLSNFICILDTCCIDKGAPLALLDDPSWLSKSSPTSSTDYMFLPDAFPPAE